MEQTDGSSAKGQEPEVCKLAVASLLVVFFGLLMGVVLANQEYSSLLTVLGGLFFLFSPIAGLILGIIASWKIYKSKGMLIGYRFPISGLVLIIIILLVLFSLFRPRLHPNFSCGSNMAGLGKAILLYASDNDRRYPTPEKWCDLLIEHADVAKKQYVCRNALKGGEKGRCHYAINPNCSPSSPGDTVLLFETKGGWNQYGGPEILTTEHHEGEGCNILFNDTHVRFIRKEQLGKLKWGEK